MILAFPAFQLLAITLDNTTIPACRGSKYTRACKQLLCAGAVTIFICVGDG